MKNNNVVDLRSTEKKMEAPAAPLKPKKNRKKMIIIISVVVALMIIGVVIWLILKPATTENVTSDESETKVFTSEPVTPTASYLTGLPMSQDEALKPITAIMIENISTVFDSHYGLTSADVVYETLAEGGIPRFVAVFQSRYPKQIGPVRSARPYYVDMIKCYGPEAEYIYSGAAKIIDDDVRDRVNNYVNAGYYGPYFWRGPEGAPHNLFTSGEKLALLRKDNGWEKLNKYGDVDAWTFQSGTAKDTDQSVKVNFSGATYQVRWEFNQDNNSYMRFNAGGAHIDQESDQQVEVSNVIIMKTQMGIWEGGPDDGKGRIEVAINENHGDGLILKNGEAIEIDWSKGTEHDNFKFFEKGTQTPVSLQPGKSWVQVISDDKDWEIE